MTNPSFFLKSMCLHLAIALMALLAIGPFLHAHYGTSKVTGLHVAGVSTVSASHAVDGGATSIGPDEELESAALGVETSYARQLSLDVQDPPQAWLIGAIFALMVTAAVQVLVAKPQAHRRLVGLAFLAGFPPLPHAPPPVSF